MKPDAFRAFQVFFAAPAMADDANLKLNDREIAAAFADAHWAERFPPVLSLEQAAEMLQMPVGTLRDWRSRGLLGSCSRKIGKRVRIFRDRLLKQVFNIGLDDEAK